METSRSERLLPIVYAAPFLLAFGLSVLMLGTDTNLQTNFGTTPKYYLHWYGVAAMAAADLVAVALLLVLRSRLAVKLSVVGSAVLVAVFAGVVFTYHQVGFTTMTQFADYLYGITYYGGDIRYLYDALLATYVGTFVAGIVGLLLTRPARSPAAPSGNGNATST